MSVISCVRVVKSSFKTFISIFAIALSFAAANAQNSPADTAFLSSAKKNTYNIYKAGIGDQSNLHNGSEYKEYLDRSTTIGMPYFLSDDWTDGNVFYDSALYTNVGLMYDLVIDKVILDQPFSHFKLQLISEKVKYFEFQGHYFTRLLRLASDSSVRTGFYEVLYNGKTKAYVRRSRERKETAKSREIEVEYLNRDAWFIYHDGVYTRVRTKSGVWGAFGDRKKIIKKKLKAYGRQLDFKNRREEYLAAAARLFDESTGNQ